MLLDKWFTENEYMTIITSNSPLRFSAYSLRYSASQLLRRETQRKRGDARSFFILLIGFPFVFHSIGKKKPEETILTEKEFVSLLNELSE